MKHLTRWIALLLVLCFLMTGAACAEVYEDERVCFLLICNEGMSNTGGNVGNTLMMVSFDIATGKIRLLMFAWDTFIDMEGFDTPQLIEQPYRQNGPDETLKVVDSIFGLNIDLVMSLNYLNLANLIDDFDGVNVEVTRAERNALNGMVTSKKENIITMANLGMLQQMLIESLVSEYYLDDWGPDTHLNGLQAVGYGWLQYDSVANCCLREGKVISQLFYRVGERINDLVILYTNDQEVPEETGRRRLINLDDPTDDDVEYLYKVIEPIFEKSYHNLAYDDIISIALSLGRAAYSSAMQGIDIFNNVDCMILPLEVYDPFDMVAGRTGHLVDYEANGQAIREFLYAEN